MRGGAGNQTSPRQRKALRDSTAAGAAALLHRRLLARQRRYSGVILHLPHSLFSASFHILFLCLTSFWLCPCERGEDDTLAGVHIFFSHTE